MGDLGPLPKEIQDLYDKSQVDNNISIDEINSFGDNKSIKSMIESIADYDRMLQEKIVFVNDALTKIIPFTRENLYLLCAQSGAGKSSTAANISYPLWQQKKKVLIIANEEASEDVLMRISCLKQGVSFNEHKKGTMDSEVRRTCIKGLPEIAEYVKVIDVNYKEGITTSVEGVINILETIAKEDFSCVMIDYFQLIKRTEAASKVTNTYESLDKLRLFLGRYIKNANMPVVLFAQLHSEGKRSKDMDSRVKDCPTIIEPATVVIEIKPCFQDSTTALVIHKDRFGMAGKSITCRFDKGRYIYMDQKQQKTITRESTLSDLSALEDKLAGIPDEAE